MSVKEAVSLPELGVCTRCKFVSSQKVCKACVLLEGLNKGLPRLGIGKSSKVTRMLEEHTAKQLKEKITNGKCCGTGTCKNKSILKQADIDLNDIDGDRGNTTDSTKNCIKIITNDNSNINSQPLIISKSHQVLKEYEINSSDKITENHFINKEDNTSGINYSQNIQLNNDEDLLYNSQEDDSCSGTCEGIGSLQIGF